MFSWPLLRATELFYFFFYSTQAVQGNRSVPLLLIDVLQETSSHRLEEHCCSAFKPAGEGARELNQCLYKVRQPEPLDTVMLHVTPLLFPECRDAIEKKSHAGLVCNAGAVCFWVKCKTNWLLLRSTEGSLYRRCSSFHLHRDTEERRPDDRLHGRCCKTINSWVWESVAGCEVWITGRSLRCLFSHSRQSPGKT